MSRIPSTTASLLTALVAALVLAAPAGAAFGIATFDGEVTEANGAASTQAGGHPYGISTTIEFNRFSDPENGVASDGDARTVSVDLPPGLIGNPQVVPACDRVTFYRTIVTGRSCPPETQVGTVDLTISLEGSPFTLGSAAIWRLAPDGSHPATFAFYVVHVPILLEARVRPGDFGISIDAPETSQVFPLLRVKANFWGAPADPRHDSERRCATPFEGSEGFCESRAVVKPLLTNPTACTPEGVGLETKAFVSSWAGETDRASFFSHLPPPNEDVQAGPDGCDRVPFGATGSIRATSNEAGSPTGLHVRISTPQSDDLNVLGTAHLKRAEVTLPEGMAVNPSSVEGLAACGASQIGLDDALPPRCPESSKIGSVSVESPAIEKPLSGSVYLAKQGDNKFGSLLAMYIVVEGEGVRVKLAGRIESDPATGRLTTSFDDNPQLPFSSLELRLKSGPRAPLVNPPRCGTHLVRTELAPWSGTPPVVTHSPIEIASGPGGGPCPLGAFEPRLEAGTANPSAGRYSRFDLRLSREDATQPLRGLQIGLPNGLTGKLAGIPYCPDAALAAVSGDLGTGAAQLGAPSCPAASQVGTVSVGAGAGARPFYVHTGKAYLAGPYKGAALSLAVVTPAVAGPFDLGSVVVRNALHVDPTSARITAISDPIPTILHGIPLGLRDLRIALDRESFTLNPTNCSELRFTGSATAPSGATAPLTERFQAVDCASLRFAPRLSLTIRGKDRRGAYQKLRAVLTQPRGQANIREVSVALPHSQFLAQNHINTICTRVQFAAHECPKGSIYGRARAFTPLLDEPLEGPVYLRSSSNQLPDLVAALRGQVDIELVGKIDSFGGGIRTTFAAVPDAPVSKFVLNMRGGRKSLLQNSRDICKNGTGRATVKMDGQNGKAHDFRPRLRNSCAGTKGK